MLRWLFEVKISAFNAVIIFLNGTLQYIQIIQYALNSLYFGTNGHVL